MCRVCVLSQLVQEVKECRRLALEQPHIGKKIDHAHRDPFRFGRTNDRTHRKTWTNEWTWLRHNQVGLEIFSAEWRRIQVRKCHRVVVTRVKGSYLKCIARLVLPGLEVHCFGRADADQNSQDFHVVSPLGHRWIKAVTTLLDGRKMESSRVGDHLKKITVRCVIIGSRNGRVFSGK